MSTAHSLRRGWICCALAFGNLGLVGAVVPCEATGGQRAKQLRDGQVTERDAKEAAKMVEAIANRNKPPKIVRRREDYPSRFPLFPRDYDWQEEGRVREALTKLKQDKSIEIWEALVQKANDRRYCVTSYSGNSADAEIYSVGDICHSLAYDRLCEVFEKYLPSLPPKGRPFFLESVSKDLVAWRKERKDRPFYQLQIEVCEMALRELPKVPADEMSDKQKAEARKKIEAGLEKLRGTRRPFAGESSGYTPASYPREEAERVRVAYEKGSLEEFRSGLNK